MSNDRCVLPMESYRLAQYAVQTPCYICDGPNTFDAEMCRHCQASMALAHQANTQDILPQMVAVIGLTGAGKTVYLGMLTDMLSRENDRMQILARGAFSITLQQITVGALARREFPCKTPSEPDSWNWIHCQVRMSSRRRAIELIVPDMAGEAILEEIDHPRTFPVIHSFLTKCSGVAVLIDAARIEEGEQDQDFFTMKILSYLSELDDRRKKAWQIRSVALVFTKADQCESCYDDPAAFAQKKAPGVWQHCRERFEKHRFFASGVAGACAFRSSLGGNRVRVPLRVEPHGVIEPFEWLVQQLRK